MIYLVYGEDTFLSGEYLNYLIRHYQQDDLFYFSYDFNDPFALPLTINELKEKLNSYNLFSNTRLIVLKNVISYAPEDFQKECIKIITEDKIDASKSTMLIIYENDSGNKSREDESEDGDEEKETKKEGEKRGKASERKKIFEWFKKKAKLVKEFPLLKGVKLSYWLSETAQQFHFQLDPETKKLILDYFGFDTGLIFFTLKKLSLIQKALITKKDLEENAWLPFNNDVFEFLDNLAARKIPTAFRLLLNNLEEDSSPSNILRLLGSITFEIRSIIMVKESKAKTFMELAKETKIKPYPLRKIISLAKSFSLEELKTIYPKLLLCDERIKRYLMPSELALQMLLLDIRQILTN
ncbi:MAG: DNA polymerase III subunit delta [Minisyncoccia bacterium]